MFSLSSLNIAVLRRSSSYQGTERRRCGERRVHADRRREPRIGDIRERRSDIRRSKSS